MSGRILGRRLLLRRDVIRLARQLAMKLAERRPTMVIYLERGGRQVGRTIAQTLDIPVTGLDLRYPLSRLPFPFSLLAFPIKEIGYRLTAPSVTGSTDAIPAGPVALVDDSASTGRSLTRALETLTGYGVSAPNITTAVIRCGPKARSLVDFYLLAEPVIRLDR